MILNSNLRSNYTIFIALAKVYNCHLVAKCLVALAHLMCKVVRYDS